MKTGLGECTLRVTCPNGECSQNLVSNLDNSSFQNHSHLDNHTIRTTDTPGFKPFTIVFDLTIACRKVNILLNLGPKNVAPWKVASRFVDVLATFSSY